MNGKAPAEPVAHKDAKQKNPADVHRRGSSVQKHLVQSGAIETRCQCWDPLQEQEEHQLLPWERELLHRCCWELPLRQRAPRQPFERYQGPTFRQVPG